jgi:drug/metabolite transporter (DMT)-like permease
LESLNAEIEPAIAAPARPAKPVFWNSPGHAAVMLILATLCWGMSFPLVKNWQLAVKDCPGGQVFGSFLLIALRMFLALLIFAAVRPSLYRAPSKRSYGIGLLLGGINFVGIFLQVEGLVSATPALSGFFTSLASAWVPLLAWLCFRLVPGRATLWGLGLGVVGLAILGIEPDQGWKLGVGETLTLLSSIVFGVGILLIDRLGRSVPPGHLTVGFLAGHAVPASVLALAWAGSGAGIAPCVTWTAVKLQDLDILRDLGLLTLFCTVLAFHWMTVYQPRISAGRAALIYLLEPVFAAGFSICWGHDSVTLRLVAGGGLILAGNLLVELPVWLRTKRTKRT